MQQVSVMALAVLMSASVAAAQTPQPFPRIPPRPAPTSPAGPPPAPSSPAPTAPAAAAAPAESDGSPVAPTEATLGFPIYPSAQFITSYDAGRGQRYYLFGSTTAFADLVKYYQTTLKTKGTLVFEAPATQVFEIGKYRDETIAYPPGVTIKDYTWSNGPGYLNPDPKGSPQRFPTIIQIVPAPAGIPPR